jgi:NADPH2:quinone reductase
LLNRVADLVDADLIRTTMNTNFGLINAANMKRAHTTIESRTAIGKLVLSGFK